MEDVKKFDFEVYFYINGERYRESWEAEGSTKKEATKELRAALKEQVRQGKRHYGGSRIVFWREQPIQGVDKLPYERIKDGSFIDRLIKLTGFTRKQQQKRAAMNLSKIDIIVDKDGTVVGSNLVDKSTIYVPPIPKKSKGVITWLSDIQDYFLGPVEDIPFDPEDKIKPKQK